MEQAGVEPITERCTHCLKDVDHLEGCPITLPEDVIAEHEFYRGLSDGFNTTRPGSSDHPSYKLGNQIGTSMRLQLECDPFDDMF